MEFKLDFHSGKPIYRQIVEYFIEAIGRGELEDRASIPSIRELAEALSVNPNTVAKAYKELEREGYIYARPGIGMFVKLSKNKIRGIIRERIKKNLKGIFLSAQRHGISLGELGKVCEEVLQEIKQNEPND